MISVFFPVVFVFVQVEAVFFFYSKHIVKLEIMSLPLVFQANILKAALQSAIQAGADITDDCSAVERLGKEVWLAPGWRENIKITTREDLTMAEAFLREREKRA